MVHTISLFQLGFDTEFRMSATNCANSYTQTFSGAFEKHLGASNSFHVGACLLGRHVYDGFLVLTLLRHWFDLGSALVVPRTGLQEDRFKDAAITFNAYIRLYGMPTHRHGCKRCCRFYEAAGDAGKGDLLLLFGFVLI
jgi:hypothetical protein